MKCKELKKLINDAGYQTRSYSGRNMYKGYCLGVVCDEPHKVVADILLEQFKGLPTEGEEGDDTFVELAQLLGTGQVDSMGRSSILYFSGIKWED